jgi:hypothetical protein
VLDGVPASFPAMTRALKLQEKAGKVGFDWNDARQVLDKIAEETTEVREALVGRSDTVLRRIGQYRQRSVWELFSRASAVRLHHARPVVVDGRTVGVLLLSRSPRGLFKGLHEDRGKLLLGAGIILLVLFSEGGRLFGAPAPTQA